MTSEHSGMLYEVPDWEVGNCFDCKKDFTPTYRHQYFCDPCRQSQWRLTTPVDLVKNAFYRNMVKRTQKGAR